MPSSFARWRPGWPGLPHPNDERKGCVSTTCSDGAQTWNDTAFSGIPNASSAARIAILPMKA